MSYNKLINILPQTLHSILSRQTFIFGNKIAYENNTLIERIMKTRLISFPLFVNRITIKIVNSQTEAYRKNRNNVSISSSECRSVCVCSLFLHVCNVYALRQITLRWITLNTVEMLISAQNHDVTAPATTKSPLIFPLSLA